MLAGYYPSPPYLANGPLFVNLLIGYPLTWYKSKHQIPGSDFVGYYSKVYAFIE